MPAYPKAQEASPPLVVVASNTDWSIANFRGGLIRRLQAEGYRVVALAPACGQGIALPCELIPIAIERKSTSPLRDAGLMLRLGRLLRTLRPFAVLTFTAKLNLYGVVAARRAGARAVSNVSGLGSGFLGSGLLAGALLVRVMQGLYRWANRRADAVFFQNGDDLRYFLDRGLVQESKAVLVPGSGVDLQRYRPAAEPAGGSLVFLLIARLLRDKGVVEYVEAARLVRSRHPGARFRVLGQLDPGNPSAISEGELRSWVEAGTIEHLGWRDDVRPAIAGSHCVVLPSYREGMSRTLLEAAAMGRPVIATDVPGCRQAVEHGSTGYLCRVRDCRDLAEKMMEMIELSEQERRSMGAAGRQKMEREFDERLVIERYLEVLERFK